MEQHRTVVPAPPRAWTPDFSALLARAKARDAAAVDELYRRHCVWIERRIDGRLTPTVRSKCDAADLAHEVFALLLRRLPRLEDRGEAAFRGLLALMADNVVRSHLRHHLGPGGARVEQPLGDERPDVITAVPIRVARADDANKLRRLVGELDAPSQTLLRLRADGRSYDAIARELGLPTADAARKRHARIVAELRDAWDAAHAAR